MTFIVPEEIEAYAAAHTSPPTELLQRLAEETRANPRSSSAKLRFAVRGPSATDLG